MMASSYFNSFSLDSLKYSLKSPLLLLSLISAIAFALMIESAVSDSAIMDELAHIPAGYSYLYKLDYRLNPEHPPLVKILSAIPLLFFKPNFPTNSSAWEGINGQWDMGNQFLYQAGNNADKIIYWARIPPILLTVILIIFTYIFSRKILGKWWALLPSFLVAFSPTFLAHGHYVTTDIAATFGILFSTYWFLKFLEKPQIKQVFVAGIAFGIAMLTKFSTVILIPYFLFLAIAFCTIQFFYHQANNQFSRFKNFLAIAFRYFGLTVLVFAVGFIVIVYPLYFFLTLNYPLQKQLSDTEFILTSYGGGPTPPGQFCRLSRCPAELDIWLTKNPITRPFAHYLLGVLMVLQRAAGGNTTYFLGEVSAAGSPLYFPIVYALKEPLPVLLLIVGALKIALLNFIKKVKDGLKIKKIILNYLATNFVEFSFIIFTFLYLARTIMSPLNIGLRHLLPIMPLVYILTIKSWKKLTETSLLSFFNFSFQPLKFLANFVNSKIVKFTALSLLLLWLLIEVLSTSPYFLSYFNQLGGGLKKGYRYVTDSNYDWGQDLKRLKVFIEKWNKDNPDKKIDKIAIDYFGGGNPRYYLGEVAENWWSARGNPLEISKNENYPKPIKWIAISVNTLQGAIQKLAPGQKRNPEDEYRWLVELKAAKSLEKGEVPPPDFRAGTSIFIYCLDCR